ncbi:RNA polymerase sigma factor [Paludisphaera soli]|uniref:RNA polymerase sigma factor n=1 Tax=Paludisphaera soli TaxID=2712865 RepID=UPI0013EBB16E|nr:sigma-70 family RNA polymerase sigma factor [Paludisphaera soli]
MKNPSTHLAAAERLARHDPFVRRLARRAGRSRGDGATTASDHAQDAWVAALEARARGAGPASSEKAEAAWLRTILVRKVALAWRKRKALRRGGAATVLIAGDEVADPGTTPSGKLERAAREEALARAMRSLDAQDREILALTLVEGKSSGEIAARTGVCDSYVRRLRRRALERLRAAYAAQGGTLDLS